MMKKFASLLFLMIAFTLTSAIGQSLPIDPETKKITYQETVQLDSISQEELYNRSKDWIANFFKTDKFEPNDLANYKIGKIGSFDIQLTYDFKYKSTNNVSFSLVIGQKDGRYRYTITDFRFYNTKLGEKTTQGLEAQMAKMSGQNKSETNTQIAKSVNDMITDMKRFITTGKPENKEDW